MSEHAPLPPSFAPVWGHCSAAPVAAMSAPNIETEESRAGVAAHWVFAMVLLNFQGKQEGPLHCAMYVGETAPNGVVIDDLMAEGAQVMVDDVLEVAQKHGALQSMLIEHRVAMPHIHAQNWGTLDCAIVLPGTIYLWEYKHGHRENSARENFQLIEYAEGLRHELSINGHSGHGDQATTVVFRIVQPFCYHAQGAVDEWTCKLSDLRTFANLLHDKAHEAFSNPRMSTGKHCRDCPGKLTCSARRKADYNLIDLVNEPYLMDAMTGEELAIERRMLSDGLAAAKERLKAIEADLVHRIGQGATDTGLALGATYGRLAWTVPPEQAEALATQFGFDIAKLAVKTPTQAMQAAPSKMKAAFAQVLKTVTKRPAGGLKLIDAENSIAARAFKRK